MLHLCHNPYKIIAAELNPQVFRKKEKLIKSIMQHSSTKLSWQWNE
jgi:hypothetical protein